MSENIVPPTIKSFMLAYSIPNVRVSFDTLEEIAAQAGLDPDFVPRPKSMKNAWERATNLGAGIKLDPPPSLAAKVETEYGVKPKLRLTHRVVNGRAYDKEGNPQLLERLIIREVVIPAKDEKTKGHTAKDIVLEKFKPQVVARLQFDCELNKMYYTTSRSADITNRLDDNEGWVNGNLDQEVEKIVDEVKAQFVNADGQDIREWARKWMDAKHAQLKGSGGAYLLPANEQNGRDLTSFQDYLLALQSYRLKADGPSVNCDIYPIYDFDNDDVFTNRLLSDAMTVVINSLCNQLKDLEGNVIKTLKKRPDDGETPAKIKARYTATFTEIEQACNEWESSLKVKLNEVQTRIESTFEHIRSL